MQNPSPIIIIVYSFFLTLYVYTLHDHNAGNKAARSNVINENYLVMRSKWFCFFTIWTFMSQIFFLFVAIVDEVCNLLNLFPQNTRKIINGIRSYHFQTIVLPCSAVVVIIFWTLFNYDRELIFPNDLDKFLPRWTNHVLHTVITLPCIVELSLPKKYNFIAFKKAFIGLTLYLIIYQSLFTSIYFNHGVWLYPIYKNLNWPQRILFTLIQYGLAIGFLSFGLYWQNSKRVTEKPKRRISFKMD